jgi:hypothetical protein
MGIKRAPCVSPSIPNRARQQAVPAARVSKRRDRAWDACGHTRLGPLPHGRGSESGGARLTPMEGWG